MRLFKMKGKVTMKCKNIQLWTMRDQLRPLLTHKGKIGYVAARNFRIFTDALTEYEQFRNDAIKKHGELNEEGVFAIDVRSENFERFVEEMEPYNDFEHEVVITKCNYKRSSVPLVDRIRL